MIKGNNNISYEAMHITMVDPEKGMLEIEGTPIVDRVDKICSTNKEFNEASLQMSRLPHG